MLENIPNNPYGPFNYNIKVRKKTLSIDFGKLLKTMIC